MFERWRESLDKRGKCGALFINLSKVFGFLLQDLLLAKLEGYEFSYSSLKLISGFTDQKLILPVVIGRMNYLVCLKDQY